MRQKKFHDKGAKQPSQKARKGYKLARPFMGPYQILKLYDNGADLRLISKPVAASIHVSLNQIRMCPKEMADSPVAMQPNPVPSDDLSTVASVDILGTKENDSQQSETSPKLVQSTSEMETCKVQGSRRLTTKETLTSCARTLLIIGQGYVVVFSLILVN